MEMTMEAILHEVLGIFLGGLSIAASIPIPLTSHIVYLVVSEPTH